MKDKALRILKVSPGLFAAMAMSAQFGVVQAQQLINTTIGSGASLTGYATDFGALINFVLRIVLIIAVLLVFLYLILGGIEYITSGGEKGKTEAARNKITAAIIGLIILAASYAILTLLLSVLGLGDLTTAINNVHTINTK